MCLLRLTHGADPVETVLASGGAGWRALAELSPAERTVVAHLARGLTNSGIARALGKSTATVRNQLHDVYRKLGVRSRSELLTMVLTDPQ
ncbi:MAG: LuxR family transcriptional regulator [Puniceicoccaceae bacterium]|nr:MAG: LuxR family transcriptional regulator [Puniceicoccaceae bacterium]